MNARTSTEWMDERIDGTMADDYLHDDNQWATITAISAMP